VLPKAAVAPPAQRASPAIKRGLKSNAQQLCTGAGVGHTGASVGAGVGHAAVVGASVGADVGTDVGAGVGHDVGAGVGAAKQHNDSQSAPEQVVPPGWVMSPSAQRDSPDATRARKYWSQHTSRRTTGTTGFGGKQHAVAQSSSTQATAPG